ncbi:MAG: hypothetical protein RMI53_02880 [Nitrososphaerota archaeon]|nr:hypothetical protein [Nitrososphaerota archaeon]
MMITLAVVLRLMKHYIIGPIQFVNFPAVFTFLGGIALGSLPGMTIGFASYLISDMAIGLPGPWTAINGSLMAIVGFLSGIFFRRASKIGIGVGAFLLLLCFDILSSWILYVIIGFDWFYALIIAIVGLFLPAGGGFLYAVGPITEAVTILLMLGLISTIKRNGLKFDEFPF